MPGRPRSSPAPARCHHATSGHGCDQYSDQPPSPLQRQTAFVSDSFSNDSASLLQTLADNGSGSSATYSYLANSPLVGQIAFANGGQTRMTTTKQYDHLNRLTSISSTGLAAPKPGEGGRCGYDTLGQVSNGFKSWADATLVAGEQFQYGFDTLNT